MLDRHWPSDAVCTQMHTLSWPIVLSLIGWPVLQTPIELIRRRTGTPAIMVLRGCGAVAPILIYWVGGNSNPIQTRTRWQATDVG